MISLPEHGPLAAPPRPVASAPSGSAAGAWPALRRRGDLAIALALVIISAAVYGRLRPFEQPLAGDPAIWDYMAQVIARGGIPYRDAVDFKTPLAGYLSAAALLIGESVGLRNVFAIRLTYLALAVLTVVLTCFVARDFARSWRVGVLAALVMLSFDQFGALNGLGTEPKTAGIVFGLAALWAINRGRPFVAGLCGMLAALCWQPLLLYVGVAGLAFSGYRLVPPPRRVGLVLLGAGLPLAAGLLAFWSAGALEELYRWTWHFNLTQHGPGGAEEGKTLLARGAWAVGHYYPGERWAFVLAAASLVGAGLCSARRAFGCLRRGRWPELDAAARADALLVAPLVYLAFTTTNLQGARDLFPLLPFVAIFSGAGLVAVVDLLANRGFRSAPVRARLRIGLPAVVGAAILLATVRDALATAPPRPRLRDQEREVASIVRHLGPGDAILTHDAAGLLVLTGLANSGELFWIQRHLAGYYDEHVPGGFDAWLARQRLQRPAVVVLGPRPMSYQGEIRAWLDAEYVEQREGDFYRWYLRRDRAAR